MIVQKIHGLKFQQERRHGLTGKTQDADDKGFSQTFQETLLEAFNGDFVRKGASFSPKLSSLARESIQKLGQSF